MHFEQKRPPQTRQWWRLLRDAREAVAAVLLLARDEAAARADLRPEMAAEVAEAEEEEE